MDENSSQPTSAPQESGSSSQMMYVLIGSAIVVVLLIGGFVFRHQLKTMLMGEQPAPVAQTTLPATTEQTPAAQPATMSAYTNTATNAAMVAAVEVDYTDTGFTPAKVTIKKGQTVKFVNKSSLAMDVASDPHPTHTDYPGFDQGKSTSKGLNEYDFTFDKVGTWGYHNHLNHTDKGTVVVQ